MNKDKNNKKIIRGDIIRLTYKDPVEEFGHNHIDFEVKCGDYLDYSQYDEGDMEEKHGFYLEELRDGKPVAQFPLPDDLSGFELVESKDRAVNIKNLSLKETVNLFMDKANDIK